MKMERENFDEIQMINWKISYDAYETKICKQNNQQQLQLFEEELKTSTFLFLSDDANLK